MERHRHGHRPGPLLVTAGSPTSFGDLSPDRTLLAHEMAHDLDRRRMPGAPRWFDGGLATYLESAELIDAGRVRLGAMRRSDLEHARAHSLIPLDTLVLTPWETPEPSGAVPRVATVDPAAARRGAGTDAGARGGGRRRTGRAVAAGAPRRAGERSRPTPGRRRGAAAEVPAKPRCRDLPRPGAPGAGGPGRRPPGRDARCGDPRPRRRGRAPGHALEEARAGDFARAFDSLHRAERLAPWNPSVHLVRASILASLGACDEAGDAVQRALDVLTATPPPGEVESLVQERARLRASCQPAARP